jgi:hypothetical protein
VTKIRHLFIPLTTAAAFLIIGSEIARAQFDRGAEHQAIAYSSGTPSDPVARLQRRIDAGAVRLNFDERWGYLPSLLEALDIPVSSQGLVFSKTSLQVDRIGPWAPRAIYFNDDVYVGGVQGGPILEIASVDANLGAIFYTLPQEPSAASRFAREGSTCLMCHDSASVTGGVPGLIVRSVIPDRHGYAFGSVHDGPTTDMTPIALRWGGWYVSGGAADQVHMGNVMSTALTHEVGNVRQYLAKAPVKPAPGTTSLAKFFDTSAYLSGHSDAVALMVLAHQAHVHNLITIANYETRKALHDESSGSRGTAGPPQESTLRRVRAAAEPLVRAMLFADETPLAGTIKGTSSFAADFAARAARDGQQRSLRDLDLERRLFTYRLSYLVYSESFNALPDIAKSYVYQRFREVLGGTDPEVTHLPPDERRAILDILTATKPDFR